MSEETGVNLFFESIKRSLTGLDKGGNPFDLGYDCGLNGANTTNCSFSIFANKESTQAWERGKAAGDKAKSAQGSEVLTMQTPNGNSVPAKPTVSPDSTTPNAVSVSNKKQADARSSATL